MLQQSQSLRSKTNTNDESGDDDLTSSDESTTDVGVTNSVSAPSKVTSAHDVESDDENDDGQQIVESVVRKRTLEDLEEKGDDDDDDEDEDEDDKTAQPSKEKRQRTDSAKASQKKTDGKRKAAAMIDPSQFMAVERDLSTSGVDLVTSGGDDEDGQSFKVAMAFAEDDDVVAEFVSEKKSVVDRDKPKDIDLRLPGWGEWSGPGVTTSKRRKKRFDLVHCWRSIRFSFLSVILATTIGKTELMHKFITVHERGDNDDDDDDDVR
jgi:U3 small nucleolar RNA-associated protein 14